MFGLSMVMIWLILMIVFIGMEMATLGLTSIWFALGALVAMLVAAIGGPIWLQIVIFAVVSMIALFGVRDIALKYFNQSREKTNIQGIIGKKGIVTEEISNIHATGRVTVGGQEWTARAEEEAAVYKEGEVVVVKHISGVKLIVSRE